MFRAWFLCAKLVLLLYLSRFHQKGALGKTGLALWSWWIINNREGRAKHLSRLNSHPRHCCGFMHSLQPDTDQPLHKYNSGAQLCSMLHSIYIIKWSKHHTQLCNKSVSLPKSLRLNGQLKHLPVNQLSGPTLQSSQFALHLSGSPHSLHKHSWQRPR